MVDPMGTRVDFATIEDLRNHKFWGNHAFDSQAFEGIRRFVERADTSLEDKVEAITIEGVRGMGFTKVESTGGLSGQNLVNAYLLEE